MRSPKLRVGLTLAVLLAFAALAFAADRESKSPAVAYDFSSVLPLGGDVLQLQPLNRRLYLLGSVKCAAFKGMKRVEQDDRHWVLGPDGKRLRDFPRFVTFRVTADARGETTWESETPYTQLVHGDLNDYLLHLHFRLVIFRGLHRQVLVPAFVRMIGVPAAYPADERVFLVGAELPPMSASNRLVLEVRDDTGNRLTKFHLDF